MNDGKTQIANNIRSAADELRLPAHARECGCRACGGSAYGVTTDPGAQRIGLTPAGAAVADTLREWVPRDEDEVTVLRKALADAEERADSLTSKLHEIAAERDRWVDCYSACERALYAALEAVEEEHYLRNGARTLLAATQDAAQKIAAHVIESERRYQATVTRAHEKFLEMSGVIERMQSEAVQDAYAYRDIRHAVGASGADGVVEAVRKFVRAAKAQVELACVSVRNLYRKHVGGVL